MSLCFVVDDDELNCDISARALKSIGINVLTFTDGAEALASCKNKMPDLILLDMKMPMMDGFTFIESLHKMHGGREVKIIVCTGLNDLETVQELKNTGISDYIVKPFETDVLLKKVGRLRLW